MENNIFNNISVSDVINESVKRSLFIEYWCNNNRMFEFRKRTKEMLYEEHGIKSDIDIYWNILKEYIQNNENTVIEINDNIFSNIPGCFFKDVNIIIWLSSGTSNAITMPTKLNNGKIEVFNTMFNLDSFKLSDVIKELRPLFYHEFMHLYEDYMRLTNDTKSIHDIATDTGYGYIANLYQCSIEKLRKSLYYLIYFLYDFEVNAIVGNIASEIKDLDYIPRNHKDANKILKELKTYKLFNDVGNIINYFKSLTIYDIKKDEDKKIISKSIDIIIDAWEEATNKKSTFDDILNKLEKMFVSKFRKFKVVASKLLYDETKKEPETILDDGIDMNFDRVSSFLRSVYTKSKPRKVVRRKKQK